MPEIVHYSDKYYEAVWALHQKTVAENPTGFVQNLSFHHDMHEIPTYYHAFFLLLEGEDVIGMVGLRVEEEKEEGLIKRLQIHSDYKGKGYGKMLMRHVIDYAKGQGFRALTLNFSDREIDLYPFYSAFGFERTGGEERVYGPDQQKFLMTYMRKEL